MSSRINHLAVFVSAIAFYVLGWIWYDMLFGHAWMALTGRPQQSASSMAGPLAGGFLLCWFLAYALSITLGDSGKDNPVRHGAEHGGFIGLGVFGSMLALNYVYEGRGLELWLINTGYVVIGMAMIGAIMGAMRKKEVAATA